MFMKMKLDDGWRDGDRNFRYYEMSISSELHIVCFPNSTTTRRHQEQWCHANRIIDVLD